MWISIVLLTSSTKIFVVMERFFIRAKHYLNIVIQMNGILCVKTSFLMTVFMCRVELSGSSKIISTKYTNILTHRNMLNSHSHSFLYFGCIFSSITLVILFRGRFVSSHWTQATHSWVNALPWLSLFKYQCCLWFFSQNSNIRELIRVIIIYKPLMISGRRIFVLIHYQFCCLGMYFSNLWERINVMSG